jgi:hypothetical protein
MLDRVDETGQWPAESLLLRSESAMADHRPEEARFHFQSLETSQKTVTSNPANASSNNMATYLNLRLAMLDVSSRDFNSAKHRLKTANHTDALTALSSYTRERDKSPRLGGWLGLVPGLGYAYSREYANALRSLLLNGIFIFGMIQTGEDDQWGAFGVITFFEISWYTGSIYGGVDSAHRYNLRRLESCLGTIGGDRSWEPDLSHVPTITLRFKF